MKSQCANMTLLSGWSEALRGQNLVKQQCWKVLRCKLAGLACMGHFRQQITLQGR